MPSFRMCLFPNPSVFNMLHRVFLIMARAFTGDQTMLVAPFVVLRSARLALERMAERMADFREERGALGGLLA